MTKPRQILESVYKRVNLDRVNLLEAQQNWIETIIEEAESQKAVLAVLITSLVKKIETPIQDIRFHKVELTNGYSGRTFDTNFVTPFIREKFPRFAMKSGSGWLTRSLEQAHPYTLDFPGKIRNTAVKNAFLQILNDVEENQAEPEKYLQMVFALLISKINKSQAVCVPIIPPNFVSIEKTIDFLKAHFFHHYEVAGASRLPVLAIYSVYELLMNSDRYKNKKLLPLKSHTTSDLKSAGIGDIEIVDAQDNFFEAIEIKHNIPISRNLVESAFDKFNQTTVQRYYLLTTAEPDVENQDAVREAIQEIRARQGCEVIVNGIIPSLRYYLRSLANPKAFLERYSANLQSDFSVSTDIKEVHLRLWNDLLRSMGTKGSN